MRDISRDRAELLAAWRDAAQAAELAERLAGEAAEAARHAGKQAVDAGEIARLAREVAASASRAAERAVVALDQAIGPQRPDAAA